jgi:membrane protein DedA with SNARE-associated domain
LLSGLPLAAPFLALGSITGSLADVATSLVGDLGVPGVFVLMLLDCALIPIPSEVTMLFAGFGVSAGRFSLLAVIAAGTIGNLVGSQLAYALGYFGRVPVLERVSRRLHLHQGALDRAQAWFDRYGAASILLGRLLPLVRTFISLPAGLARMRFGAFSVLTLIGCLPWVTALAVLGNAVGHNWTAWRDHLRYLDYLVIAVAAAGVLVLTLRWIRRRVRLRA